MVKFLSLKKYIKVTVFLSVFLGYSTVVYADVWPGTWPSINQMIQNFSHDASQLMRMVTAAAYVMGIAFIYKSVMGFKQYGEQRTMMSSHTDIKIPITLLFVGAGLLYLPSTVSTMLNTFWQQSTPTAYNPDAGSDWSMTLNAIYIILTLVGTIAFIRGWLLLAQTVSHGAQPGTFARAITHMVGGVLLINIYGFVEALYQTLFLGK